MTTKFTDEQIKAAFEDLMNSEFMRRRRYDMVHGTTLSHEYIEKHGVPLDEANAKRTCH